MYLSVTGVYSVRICTHASVFDSNEWNALQAIFVFLLSSLRSEDLLRSAVDALGQTVAYMDALGRKSLFNLPSLQLRPPP